ncbi:MAG: hypothetical protein ABI616_00140 [Pseudomonadota bacterium]
MWEFLLGHSLWAFRSGELAFARGWPLWVLFVLGALGLAGIVATMLRNRQLGALRMTVLGVLQFAFLALLLALLWRPVLNVERIRDRENVVALLVDDSGSTNARPDVKTAALREQAVQALEAGVTKQLASSSELRLFSFSDRAASVESLAELKGGASATRIGEALESMTQMAASVPLAGIIVVTDGAETGGTLDEATLARLAATGIPIHTVGLGPESLTNDLELEQLQVPGTGVAGETMRATVSIRHQGQRSTRVRVYDGGELVAAQDVILGTNAGLTSANIEFPAGKAGLRDLRVVVDTARDETNVANNARRALVEVSDRRRSVLYIEGEPRWEYKFIRRAIEADKSLRLVSVVRATPNRYYRQGVTSAEELADGFPRTAAELDSYDAVIIGSLEAAALSTQQHEWLRDFVDKRGGSLLMLAGRDGLGDGGWGRVPVGALLPSVLPRGASPSYGARASQVRLTTYGAASAVGQLDADPAKNVAQWATMPALADFQSLGRLRPGAIVLLEALAADHAEPLLVTQRYGRGATWLLATATTWRWQMRLPLPDQRHELFWKQMLHALSTPSPAQVSLRSDHSVAEDGPLELEAEVLDETFQPMPAAQVEVTATGDSGETVPARVEPSGRGDGRYNVNVQSATPGLYRIELKAHAGARELPGAIAHVRREVGVSEHFSAYQHRPMLERIARESGGRYWRLDQISDLPEAIRYSRAGMVERQTLDLWNMPLAFLLLGMLKLAEWLLRRHWRRL